jgi:uncharacterized lipoprotein YddW (UPF0748 family)
MFFRIKKNHHLIVIFILLVLTFPFRSESKDDCFRGIWITRENLVSKKIIDKIIDTALKGRFNNLLVQVRGRGDAYYKSRFVPIAEDIKSNIEEFDPLQYFIMEAHKKNIKVHCWFNTYFLWSSQEKPKNKNHLYFTKPEWFCVPNNLINKNQFSSQIQTDLIFISPGIDDVRNYLFNVIREVIDSYAIDGIHLDYVRYANENFCYNEVLRKKFFSLYNVDPLDLVKNPEKIEKSFSKDKLLEFERKWQNFRGEQITIFVRQIKNYIEKRNSSIVFSTAVIPDIDKARNNFFQFWDDWVNNQCVDFVVPMNYVVSQEEYKNNIEQMLNYVPKENIVMGISLMNQSRYKVASKIFLTKSLGIEDFCLFSYDYIENMSNMFNLF